MYNIFNKYKSTYLFFIKLLIVGAAIYFISYKIFANKALTNNYFLNRLQENILSNFSIVLIIILFTLANWFLEILKWQTLISTIKSTSLFEASKQSLSSLTASLLTPNRVGEYGAKAIYYPKFERHKVLILNFLGNINQMMATIIFGMIGLFFLKENLPIALRINSLKWILFAVITLLIFVSITKNYWVKYWVKLSNHIQSIPNKIHKRNLLISILRYLIFSHQFYFLLIVFGAEIDYFSAMSIIFTMYFIASIIPSFVVFDWLIKGSVAVTLFNIYEINEIVVLSITSLMWLLNFALPSIIGSYFVLTFKPTRHILKERKVRL